MAQRVLRLGTILSASTGLVMLLVLVIAGALGAVTTALRRSAARLANSTESALVAEQVQINLERYEHAPDVAVRRDLAHRIRREIYEAHHFVDTEAERKMLDQVQIGVESFLEAGGAVGEEPTAALEAVQAFVQVNHEQALAERERAARWDRASEITAVVVGGTVILLGAWLLWWLNSRAFQPVLGLAHAMDRFGRGDRGARAEETGPAELAEMARRFNQMAAALSAERDAQLAFLAGVAHDLRSPLGALRVSLGALDPGTPLPPEPRLRKAFERAHRHIQRLDRMIDDLLDTWAIEAGRLKLELERCDARELVREAFDLFEGTSAGHTLVLELPEESVESECDPARLVQVVRSPQRKRRAREQPRRGIDLSGSTTAHGWRWGAHADGLSDDHGHAGCSRRSVPLGAHRTEGTRISTVRVGRAVETARIPKNVRP